MYDIIFLGSKDSKGYTEIKERFPLVKCAASLSDAVKKSFTKFFWVVWPDIKISNKFNFDYVVPEWDQQYVHVFKNNDVDDGVCLISKTAIPTEREFKTRFFITKKEIDVVASMPRQYDIFNINTYDEYLNAVETSTTEMFWVVPDDIVVSDDFKFDIYFTHHNQYDRKSNHVFLNDKYYDGIILASKNKVISQREFDHRFLVEKKEWEIVASVPKKYDIFNINTYDEYLNAVETSTTEMFWVVPDDIVVSDDFKFDIYFSHYNSYDRSINHVFLNDQCYDGVILASKNKLLAKKEFEHRFVLDRKEWEIVASVPKKYDIFNINTYEEYLNAVNSSTTEMFWVVFDDLVVLNNFKFDMYFTHHNQYDRKSNHVFLNDRYYDGVILASKNKVISQREFDHRFLVEKKEWEIVASVPKLYDKIYINSYNDYLAALENATTEMFWVVFDDLVVLNNFKFDMYFSHHNSYDRSINHVFLNDKFYDGIILASKHKSITKREFDYRFLSEKKEWEIVASVPKKYDIFNINTYEEYLNAVETSTSEMFWVVFDDLVVLNNFKFDMYFSHHNSYDRSINHVFLNDKFYDGIILASKNKVISQREFDHRFLVEKKEWETVASVPKKYDIFNINTYEEYLNAVNSSTTEMFWVVFDDLVVLNNFKFDMYFSHHDSYDRSINHVFLNDKFYDGIILASKNKVISQREFDYRFLSEKKEWEIVASMPKKYDIFNINTYEEYLNAVNSSTTEMFYGVFNDLILSDFAFDYQVPKYNQHLTHVFKNGQYYDGICLFSKLVKVSEREFKYRFFADKKEVNILASTPKPFDIVFISYFEKTADENYQKLLSQVGETHSVYRVDGVKGIHYAHRRAAEIVKSDMFWVVDADAILEPTFNFEFPQVVCHDTYTKSIVHVWRSRNPINDLEYGYGGVKLFPRQLTLDMDMTNPDMTTSISASFKAMPAVSNVAGFNTDPFTTWRSAFRECVKLSSKTIQGQEDRETEDRLNIWCTVGEDREFGSYAIAGAIAGRKYGQENAGNLPALRLINDYDWLKTQFEQTHLPSGTLQQ